MTRSRALLLGLLGGSANAVRFKETSLAETAQEADSVEGGPHGLAPAFVPGLSQTVGGSVPYVPFVPSHLPAPHPAFESQLFGSKSDGDAASKQAALPPFYKLEADDIEGNKLKFDSLKGKVVLVGNVASACGYTKNHYEQLIQLNRKFPGKLVILAFPCNQFGGQEPGDRCEIQDFTKKAGVPPKDKGFVIMDKVDVNGPNTHPVYQFLKGATPDGSDIQWNFASYWLVSPSGEVTRLTGGRTMPSDFGKDIDEALTKEALGE